MPDAEDRRALLNAIVYGDDPKVTISDRLRALALLKQFDELEPVRSPFYEELAHMSDEELDRYGDAISDPDEEEVKALVSGTSTRQPRLAAAIHAEVERRIRERATGESAEL